MKKLSSLNVKLYLDGANIEEMKRASQNELVSGFTTNPTLMRKDGIVDYVGFALKVIKSVPDYPISFEVFSDGLSEMEREARVIATWGKNVFIKIPITNTQGVSTRPLIKKLSKEGMKLNVTAIMTLDQVDIVAESLNDNTEAVVSIFAGRIADTGRDPIPIMKEAKLKLKHLPKAQLLWASPRELLNLFHAEECGCDILTATPDIINKAFLVGKDLNQFSLETVKMFYEDALASKYEIK